MRMTRMKKSDSHGNDNDDDNDDNDDDNKDNKMTRTTRTQDEDKPTSKSAAQPFGRPTIGLPVNQPTSQPIKRLTGGSPGDLGQ